MEEEEVDVSADIFTIYLNPLTRLHLARTMYIFESTLINSISISGMQYGLFSSAFFT